MIRFLEFLQQLSEEMGGDGGGDAGSPLANTTGNVQGLRTEPLVTKARQRKLIRRKLNDR
jgi:hypothetical protein